MPHTASKDNELAKDMGSAGSRTPGSSGTPTRLPPLPDAAAISLAAAAGNPHAAAAVAAAAAAGGCGISCAAAGGCGGSTAAAGS